jgi:ubiquinone/menaquinone biosynthesis C-methylase UbiE
MASHVVERIAQDDDSLFFHEHAARYRFGIGQIDRGPVLDIATGTGYGARMLADAGHTPVVAADIDLQTLADARATYGNQDVTFSYADATRMPFEDSSFHAVITLETIEHVADDVGFVGEIARVLEPDGVCVLSTPDRQYSERHAIENPYHVREYIEPELRALLARGFGDVTIFYQGFTARYHGAVATYSGSIQSDKRSLHPAMRFGVDYIYRPLKHIVPTRVANAAIKQILHREFPQPEVADITITGERLIDANVLIVVCRSPFSTVH